MKCLMPLNQRQAIAEAVNGKWFMEWGGGGTSLWMIQNANPAGMLTVEHHTDWYEQLLKARASLGECAKPWTIVNPTCTPGQNATIGEESAPDAGFYISWAEEVFDVYLIDGVVRGKCLRALVDRDWNKKPMTIFIHDTQRDWYDDQIGYAVQMGFERTDYPEGDDYPGCLLTKLERG